MSRYRVAYTDLAERGLSGLDASRRATVKSAIESSIGNDPYGCGSSPVRGNKDKRSAAVAAVVVEYEVSARVLTVTVLRAVPW